MAKLKMLLRNRNVIFLLAMAVGLLLPQAARVTQHLVLPALALAMALSTMEIESSRVPSSALPDFPCPARGYHELHHPGQHHHRNGRPDDPR